MNIYREAKLAERVRPAYLRHQLSYRVLKALRTPVHCERGSSLIASKTLEVPFKSIFELCHTGTKANI